MFTMSQNTNTVHIGGWVVVASFLVTVAIFLKINFCLLAMSVNRSFTIVNLLRCTKSTINYLVKSQKYNHVTFIIVVIFHVEGGLWPVKSNTNSVSILEPLNFCKGPSSLKYFGTFELL